MIHFGWMQQGECSQAFLILRPNHVSKEGNGWSIDVKVRWNSLRWLVSLSALMQGMLGDALAHRDIQMLVTTMPS